MQCYERIYSINQTKLCLSSQIFRYTQKQLLTEAELLSFKDAIEIAQAIEAAKEVWTI